MPERRTCRGGAEGSLFLGRLLLTPADRLAGLARHGFLLGPVEQENLVVARPHRLAAVELDRYRAVVLVFQEEGHAVGCG